jgi:hypothetical protein
MSLRLLRTPALCAIAVLGTACGGVAQSVHSTTTTRPVGSDSLQQVIKAGRLMFKLPLSWAVGYGVCRCAWGSPDTATLDNGPQEGGVACNCPAESSNAPSGLHLYEGQSGFISGGRPTVINDLEALVSLDTSNAIMTATFPGVDQWITISPDPQSANLSTRLHQVAIERQILATFTVNSNVPE